jgi:hypothetical protein
MIGVAPLIAVLAFILRVTGGRYLSTDDACIRARKLMVSSDVSGLVSEVAVQEGEKERRCDRATYCFASIPSSSRSRWRTPRPSRRRPPLACNR